MVKATLQSYPHFKDVLWIPTGEPPHKTPETYSLSPEAHRWRFPARDRLRMVALALQDTLSHPCHPHVKHLPFSFYSDKVKHWIWTQECPQDLTTFPGPHYTARTLQTWYAHLPTSEMFQCLFSHEAMLGLPRWQQLEWLLEHVTWYVTPRQGYGAWSLNAESTCYHTLCESLQKTSCSITPPRFETQRVLVTPEHIPPWSATAIREALFSTGYPSASASTIETYQAPWTRMTTPSVVAYIMRNAFRYPLL